MTRLDLSISESDLKLLVVEHFRNKLGDVEFKPSDVVIEVKSKQNYKSEWEIAEFRAKVSAVV